MKRSPQKGFTLIEIVIVLAIAALIMVIVFLAVAGAQRSQRDTTLKNDAARLLASAEQFASANSGSYPTTLVYPAAAGCTFCTTNYLKGINTKMAINAGATGANIVTSTDGTIYYTGPNRTCTTPSTIVGGNDKQIAVYYFSEVANAQQCISN